LSDGQIFNNVKYNNELPLNYYLKKSSGVGLFFFRRVAQRFEMNFNVPLKNFYEHQWVCLFPYLTKIIPSTSSIEKRQLLNIFFLDLLNTYKGWRHSKGLPVRGQRTWTNAQTTYKSNLVLRIFKIKLLKRMYGNVSLKDAAIAYFAEQVNLLWKLQWSKEWAAAKKRQWNIIRKKRGAYKIDLYGMARGQVVFNELKKTTSKKKKRN